MNSKKVNVVAFILIALLAVTLFGLSGCTSSNPASSQSGPSYQLEVNFLDKVEQFTVDSQGRLKSTMQLSSDDGKISLFMSPGTEVLDKDNKPLQLIKVTADSRPPLPPGNTDIVGPVYDLTPVGAQFNPALQLTIAYDLEGLPAGASESNLYVASYQDGEWNALHLFWHYNKGSTDSHKITTTIDYCSKIALLLPLREPVTSASPNAIEVVVAGYLKHGPMQSTVQAIKEILVKYGDKVDVTWIDLGTEEGAAYFGEHGLTAHMNVIINGSYEYQVNGKDVTFQWFEGQQWTKQDLDTVLAGLVSK
jgi:hypothetical protein